MGNQIHREELTNDSFWVHCKIHELHQSKNIMVLDKNYNMRYIINIPGVSVPLYLNSVGTGAYILMMLPYEYADTSCMTLEISSAEVIKSVFINGGDCYDNYNGKRRVEGIMLLQFDLLNYFMKHKMEKKIHMTDSAVVNIKGTNAKKFLMVQRALDLTIPVQYISIYDKYMITDTESKSYKDLEAYVNELRKLTWDTSIVSQKGYDKYPGMLLFDALSESEELEVSTGQPRFADLFYGHEGDVFKIAVNLSKLHGDLGTFVTYESLYQIFSDE